MVQEVTLLNIELKKNDYDLITFELVYHLSIDCKFCEWNITKLKADFVKLNKNLPAQLPTQDFVEIFPFWGIRPNETKIAKHQILVEGYVSFLNEIEQCDVLAEFLEINKHEVLTVALDVLKDLRGTNDTGTSEVQVWDMLNSCDEDLILTEKQLHSLNTCSPPPDLQIPFLELRRALENIENVKVIGNGFDDSHHYKPVPNLDMSHFNSLVSLTLADIDFKGVSEFGCLCDTLQHLAVKAGVQEISEILIWVEETEENEGGAPVAWQLLETLDLSRNSIEVMDESLQMLIHLTSLNLSHNKILTIDNIQGLPYLDEVNLSHNNIVEINALHLKMGNVTKLNLSDNHIKLLSGLERLFSLEDLDLSGNCIDQHNELNRLRGLPQLQHLQLLNNPLHDRTTYRLDVLALFVKNDNFKLDREPASPMELKKLWKMEQLNREVSVHLEEPICVIEIGELALTCSDVNLAETHVTISKSKVKNMVSISEGKEEECDEEVVTRQRSITAVVKVEKMVRLDGDNWIANFIMDMAEPYKKPTPPQPKVVEATEENLRTLEKARGRKKKQLQDGNESHTTEPTSENSKASKDSKDSKSNPKSLDTPLTSYRKVEASNFHIVPTEVYNIDETIQDLVNRYSSLPIAQLQTSYSVYRDGEFYVLGINPYSKPDRPELMEIIPKGGIINWNLFPLDIKTCDLIGDQIQIKKYGEEASRLYSQLFLHDMAHLYLLLSKMKEIGDRSFELMTSLSRDRMPLYGHHVELMKLPSDRVFQAVLGDEYTESLITFPTHCFSYCRADTPLPVVIGITENDIFIIKIENYRLLNLNQDMLAQILSDSSCSMALLYREKIANVRQVLRSFFQHTVRIEFKEDSNPFGSPKTTFSLLGFNADDIDMFIEKIDLHSSGTMAESLNRRETYLERRYSLRERPLEVIVSEQDDNLRVLKRLLRIQDLQQINCVPIRLESQYFRSLIMTEEYLFILEEDFVRWPPPCFVRHPPLTPRYSIVERIRTRFMFGITQYSEIYHGSYVLSLNYYRDLVTFERGRRDILISSYENREQIVGHVKRTWRQHYSKEVAVSSMRRYEVELGSGPEVGNDKELCMENFSSVGVEVLQRYVGEVLGDSYNIIYHATTYCLYSKQPDTEHKCGVIVTTENIHILIAGPPNVVPIYGNPAADQEENEGISDNFTLLLSHSVTDISQIVCGIFEQKIRFEFGFEVGLVTFMTRNVGICKDLQHSVMDALHCQFQNDSYGNDNVLITRKGRELAIIHLDDDRLDELRYTIAREAGIGDYNDVQIFSYNLLYQALGDDKMLVTIVITNHSLYLIKEDNVFWPLPQCNEHSIPNCVQFQMLESIPLDDMMCVHYTHFTSCDIVILYENRSPTIEHRDHEDQFCLVDPAEQLGKTVRLLTTTYQERDQLIRKLQQLKTEELPVKKLDA